MKDMEEVYKNMASGKEEPSLLNSGKIEEQKHKYNAEKFLLLHC